MSGEGTDIKDNIVPNGDAMLPARAKVFVDLEEEDDWPEDVQMPPPETREEILASLRQSIEDEKAGLGRPFDEVMAEISAEFNLPPE